MISSSGFYLMELPNKKRSAICIIFLSYIFVVVVQYKFINTVELH